MDMLLLCLGKRLIDGLVDDFLVHGVLLRNGIGDEHAALVVELTLGTEHCGQLLGGIDAVVNAEAALAGVECGELIRAVADDGDALGLEIFEGQAEVEDGLCACADDHDGGLGELLKVGGDIHGDFSAAVHAADAAGGKDVNASHVGNDHSGGDGGSAVCSACDERGQIAAAGLGDAAAGLAEVLDLLMAQTCLETAADDGDGRGDCAVIADGLLDEKRGLDVLGIGHAVGDDGALKSDDGAAFIEGGLDFGGNVQILVHNSAPLLIFIKKLSCRNCFYTAHRR